MNAACQAGIHDGQVLIRQGQVEHYIGLYALDQGYQLIHAVSIHLSCGNPGAALTLGLNLLLKVVTLANRTAGNANLVKNRVVLGAFLNRNLDYTSAAYNQYLSHFI